jgi:hypothetical protein
MEAVIETFIHAPIHPSLDEFQRGRALRLIRGQDMPRQPLARLIPSFSRSTHNPQPSRGRALERRREVSAIVRPSARLALDGPPPSFSIVLRQ